jgi:hypothetical protein
MKIQPNYFLIASGTATRAPVITQTRDVRPYTPRPQNESEDIEKTERGAVENLTSGMNNLVVTPPPSGPNSRAPSRGRHDSVTGTPSLNASAKKPSPQRLPMKTINFPGVGMRNDSDDDL